MNTTGIQLFQLLKSRVGDRETEALVDYMDSSLKETKKDIQETNLRTLATKEELANTKGSLKEEIAKTREELKRELAVTREELKGDITATREELKGDIAKTREDIKDVKSDTVRWMFAFFITILLTILGLYLKH